MIVIKEINEDRWRDCRDLRLGALKNDPTAFSSSNREEENLSEDEWKRRVKNALFAFSNDELVGMITYTFENKSKTKHIANIFGVYIIPEYREQGIGKKLINEVLKKIQNNKDIVKIKLSVNPEQKEAVKLYENAGFITVGQLKKELQVENKFYDELVMEKLL